MGLTASELLDLFDVAAAAQLGALATLTASDRRRRTERAGQYHLDTITDAAIVPVLLAAGVRVLSEESGWSGPDDAAVTVVVDPVDGSTNCARDIPYWAISLCAIDGDGMLCALVRNGATGARYTAARGEGAWRDGSRLQPSPAREVERAVVALSGLPPVTLPWRQFRALGSAALALCDVAGGTHRRLPRRDPRPAFAVGLSRSVVGLRGSGRGGGRRTRPPVGGSGSRGASSSGRGRYPGPARRAEGIVGAVSADGSRLLGTFARRPLAAAEVGAGVVRAAFGAARDVREKRPGDWVSEADTASEQAIRSSLAAAAPGIAFFGEESGGERADVGWFVDPLDGTANFLHGCRSWECRSPSSPRASPSSGW